MAFFCIPHESLTNLSLSSSCFSDVDAVPDGKMTAIHWDWMTGFSDMGLHQGAGERPARVPISRPVALANDWEASESLAIGMLLAWDDDIILDIYAWTEEKRRQHFKRCQQDALFAGISITDMERELTQLYQLAVQARQESAVVVQRSLFSTEPMDDSQSTLQSLRRERFALIVVILIVAGMVSSHFLA